MTRVEFCRDSARQQLRMDGHAGFSCAGRDIVCAGLSAICYALLGFLQNEADGAHSGACGSGQCTLHCTRSDRADAAFDMALVGLMQIEKKYPNHVRVHISAQGGDTRE